MGYLSGEETLGNRLVCLVGYFDQRIITNLGSDSMLSRSKRKAANKASLIR